MEHGFWQKNEKKHCEWVACHALLWAKNNELISKMKRVVHFVVHLIYVIRQIIVQRMVSPNKRVFLLNWWWESEMRQPGVAKARYRRRNWFDEFIESRQIQKLKRHYFFGVFGPKWVLKLVPRERAIFFTQEALIGRHEVYSDFGLPQVRLGLGFCETRGANIFRFPYWLTCFIDPSENGNRLYTPERFIERIESWKGGDWSNRSCFCSLVCRHDSHGNGAGLRGRLVAALSKLGDVECAGKWRNNTNRLVDVFQDDLLNYLTDCKFNICVENSDSPGYVTEKIWQAFISGAIPIYWGDSNCPEQDILTGNGIVFVDPDNVETSLVLVERIMTDEDFRREWVSKPKFHNDAALHIHGFLDGLRNRLGSS